MPQLRTLTAAAALAVLAACGTYRASIGPLSLEVPEGWQVSDREPGNLKITNGTIADATTTKAGTATAVFDIYVDSPQTREAFVAYLREQGVEPHIRETRVGGYRAIVFEYGGRATGGRQEAVLIPSRRVFILYRAAFREDDAAFLRGRAAFRRALRSITFSGSGSGSATSGGRHGPTRGKSAVTAMTAPAAIITNPSWSR